MNFNRWLNIIHISGLKKIIAAMLGLVLLLGGGLAFYVRKQAANQAVYSNFRQAFNNGEYAAYLDADSYSALVDKPSVEPRELLLSAVKQAVIQSSKFDLQAGNEDEPQSVVEVFAADKIIPLFFKELNDDASSLTQDARSLLQSPADVDSYNKFKVTFAQWLQSVVKDKTKSNINLSTVEQTGFLPFVADLKVSLSANDMQTMSADIVQVLSKEHEAFDAMVDRLSQAAGAATATAEVSDQTSSADNDTDEQLTTTAASGNLDETASTATSNAPSTNATSTNTANTQAKPTESAKNAAGDKNATGTQTAKSEPLPTRKVNSESFKPQANSTIPAIGVYYAVKKSDTIYALAQSAYASRYEDFESDPDKYIELVINYNKLTVRNNTVYLLEGQVVYFPAP